MNQRGHFRVAISQDSSLQQSNKWKQMSSVCVEIIPKHMVPVLEQEAKALEGASEKANYCKWCSKNQ